MFSKLKRLLCGASTSSNSLFTMRVYRHNYEWVFDNAAVGLDKEPFVAGADEVFDEIARDHYNTQDIDEDTKIDIVFADFEFPGFDHACEHLGKQHNGNTYTMVVSSIELLRGHLLWLCPALLKYYNKPPRRIYMSVSKVSR